MYQLKRIHEPTHGFGGAVIKTGEFETKKEAIELVERVLEVNRAAQFVIEPIKNY